jgi:hypothetical protein
MWQRVALVGDGGDMFRVPPESRFLQEPHGIAPQTTAFFIVTAESTSNLTRHIININNPPYCLSYIWAMDVDWHVHSNILPKQKAT